MDSGLSARFEQLERVIDALDRVAIAYSGGVDSSYLLAACLDRLGQERVLAVTVDSPLLPRHELETAQQVAQQLGARHIVVHLDELEIPEVAANPPDRCYHCKRVRFQGLLDLVEQEGRGYALLHGENADDRFDYRPGSRAAKESGAQAPLAQAGLTKQDVRALSRARGLPTWDHPPAACLATRFPYGVQLTREGLARVEAAEAALHGLLGSRGLRVRDHHPVARIEAPRESLAALVTDPVRAAATQALIQAGYLYVAVDLRGYRMGSMNDELQGGN